MWQCVLLSALTEQLVPTPGETGLQGTQPVPLQSWVPYKRYTVYHPSKGHMSGVAAYVSKTCKNAPWAKSICLSSWLVVMSDASYSLPSREGRQFSAIKIKATALQIFCKFFVIGTFSMNRGESCAFLRRRGLRNFSVCQEKGRIRVFWMQALTFSHKTPRSPRHGNPIPA